MKAVAVFPGKANSAHLAALDKPSLDSVPDGRGVLVRVLRVGVDGTDKEINAAEYGAAPKGYDFLVTGHEGFGVVEKVGANVSELKPGDFVVATVRRPGKSIYDIIGANDMTTDDTYYERGINLLHGFLTEFYVDDAEYIVKIPRGLRDVGVLLEPFTVVQKGITQAYEIQRRLRVWRPRKAAVMGAGTIGLLPRSRCACAALKSQLFRASPSRIVPLRYWRRWARATFRQKKRRYSMAAKNSGHSTSFSKPPARPPSPSTACRCWARTECWCFRR